MPVYNYKKIHKKVFNKYVTDENGIPRYTGLPLFCKSG